MSLDMEHEIITLTDDEGEEYELAHLDTLEYEGVTYMAFTPAEPENDDEDTLEIVILKQVEDDDGEAVLSTLDSDQEAEKIYGLFVVRMEQENEGDVDELAGEDDGYTGDGEDFSLTEEEKP